VDLMVEANNLQKRFGITPALRGMDLEIERGSICGVLGPNGAGKTTAVRILTTLLSPDGGWARVGGYDVVRDADRVRFQVGLAGQQAAVDDLLTGRANLRMIGRLYHLPRRSAERRADELLERFELTEAAERIAKTYSGGMRRRLDLAASLVAAPPFLVLDEPTTGLDPRSRTEMWAILEALVESGTTILLTTQYLDEADRLANRIVVVDRGSVIASGSPTQLKRSVGGERIAVVVRDWERLPAAAVALERATREAAAIEPEDRRVVVAVADRGETLAAAVRELDAAEIRVEDVALRGPTLDDVFLRLTGHTATLQEPFDHAGVGRKEATE
jgi:ABC-2 type transport system ATP-binding protein